MAKIIAIGRVWLLFKGDFENSDSLSVKFKAAAHIPQVRASLQVLISESHESIKVSMNLDIHT